MNPTDNFKYNRYQELPISELDVLVYAYQLPEGVELSEDRYGNTEVSADLIKEPAFSFFANVSKLYSAGVPQVGGVKTETMVELIARTRDLEGVQINDIIELDLVGNPSYRVFSISRHEYHFGTVIKAYKLST